MAEQAIPLRVGAGVAITPGHPFELRLEVVEHQEQALVAQGFEQVVAHLPPARLALEQPPHGEMDPRVGVRLADLAVGRAAHGEPLVESTEEVVQGERQRLRLEGEDMIEAAVPEVDRLGHQGGLP